MVETPHGADFSFFPFLPFYCLLCLVLKLTTDVLTAYIPYNRHLLYAQQILHAIGSSHKETELENVVRHRTCNTNAEEHEQSTNIAWQQA